MDMYAVSGETLTGIANAIRGKTGSDDMMTVAAMASAIEGISGGGSPTESVTLEYVLDSDFTSTAETTLTDYNDDLSRQASDFIARFVGKRNEFTTGENHIFAFEYWDDVDNARDSYYHTLVVSPTSAANAGINLSNLTVNKKGTLSTTAVANALRIQSTLDGNAPNGWRCRFMGKANSSVNSVYLAGTYYIRITYITNFNWRGI